MDEVQAGKIGREQLLEWTKTLEQYRAGKASVDARAISAESWWKLRNSGAEDRQDGIARDGFGLAAQRGDEQARGRDGGLSRAGGAAA